MFLFEEMFDLRFFFKEIFYLKMVKIIWRDIKKNTLTNDPQLKNEKHQLFNVPNPKHQIINNIENYFKDFANSTSYIINTK